MMMGFFLVVGLVLAFATLVTTHVTILLSLAWREPRWHAAIALVVPPLAPYWALRERMTVRGCLWVGSVVLYAVFLALVSH